MGDFIITVKAVGGHGCQRDKGDSEVVQGCGLASCPDCWGRSLVRLLKYQAHADVKEATLTHWPGTPEQVVDDLLTGVRHGSFRG
jgi:hypothetical protein